MNIVNDILVNSLFPDTDFVQTLSMNSVVPKYVENQEKGNPSVCKNCAEAPFKDLHVYGRSEQVTTTGAQILELVDREPVTISGLTWQIKNQCISVNGTAADEGSVTDFYICGDRGVYADVDFPEGGITISADLPKDIVMYVVKNSGTVLTYITSQNKDGSFEHISGNKYRIMFRATKKGAICDNVIKAMFNRGDVALPWEPYTGGKPSPSPDYPQEIVNAGKDGNLNVMVRGKNLLELTDTKVQNNNLKFEINKGSITFSGTADGASFIHKIKDFVVPRDGIYTISTNSDDSINESPRILISVNGAALENAFAGVTKELSTGSVISLYIRVSAAGSYNGRMIKPMIEKNSEGTVYEPYHEPQSMPVTTPNGLPGIPVSSGGNYTDENGQQWICDEVNLERGVYVQRVDKGAFDATKALTEQSVILATPIETPLTAAEIAAYKSLRTYRGTTIVEAEDKAGISVKYNMPMPKLSKNGALRRWFKRHPII